jgi:drug/metabolite transporter (DMT)-like permease
LGLLGVACYNTFQYLALRTTTPINVTLVASSAPVFMLALGSLFYGQRVRRDQLIGAVMSIIGVMLVMCRGDWQLLAQVQFVEGDVFVLIATAAWAWYSWQITLPDRDPPEIRNHWANFLMAQVVMGLVWCSLFSAAEWTLTDAHIYWSWPVVAALLYIGIGPAVLAYRCWGLGVQRVGPSVAGFFSNLTPVFAALLSSLVLGEPPRWYHLAAFVLIVGGIVVSSQQKRPSA